MKKFLALLTIGSVLAASVLPLMAADDESTGKQRRQRKASRALPQEYVKKYDKDNNGKLNDTENIDARKAYRQEHLKEYDKDGNGKLNATERQTLREKLEKSRDDKSKDKKPDPEKKTESLKKDKAEKKKKKAGKKD